MRVTHGTLPNLVIIGAMKAGTTSLHRYLSLHPEIFMSEPKELDFFVKEVNWSKGMKWYERQFQTDVKVRGESSPRYTYYPLFDGVPERMSAVLPDARLIYVVRDPIERIVSHYVHEYAGGREHAPTLAEALSHPERSQYVQVSMYNMQIQRYARVYPRSRILVVAAEDLRRERRKTLGRVFMFLDVDPSFYTHEYEEEHGRADQRVRYSRNTYRLLRLSAFLVPAAVRANLPSFVPRPAKALAAGTAKPIARPKLDSALRQALTDALQDDVDKLREWTGESFDSWCL